MNNTVEEHYYSHGNQQLITLSHIPNSDVVLTCLGSSRIVKPIGNTIKIPWGIFGLVIICYQYSLVEDIEVKAKEWEDSKEDKIHPILETPLIRIREDI